MQSKIREIMCKQLYTVVMAFVILGYNNTNFMHLSCMVRTVILWWCCKQP